MALFVQNRDEASGRPGIRTQLCPKHSSLLLADASPPIHLPSALLRGPLLFPEHPPQAPGHSHSPPEDSAATRGLQESEKHKGPKLDELYSSCVVLKKKKVAF